MDYIICVSVCFCVSVSICLGEAAGADPGVGGGGVSWGSGHPPPLLGEPKTSKRRKNVARMRTNAALFRT